MNRLNRANRHTKSLGNITLPNRSAQSHNFNDLRLTQESHPVLLTLNRCLVTPTPLCHHIGNVISIRSGKEISWIHTWRIIATMKNMKRRWTEDGLIYNTMNTPQAME